MVVRNVWVRKNMFFDVIEKAASISEDFFIVDHGSSDNTIELLQELKKRNWISIHIEKENFQGTMDDMKWKYYKVLKKKLSKEKSYILILDWDEILSDALIQEIHHLDFKKDVYFINRHTYLIQQVIDRNSYLPLLFEINSVEIAAFDTFHKLYNVQSTNTQKLSWILYHYSYTSIDDLLRKNIFYARWEAEKLFNKSDSINNFFIIWRFLGEGTVYFLYTLLYHFNFLSIEGFLYSFNWYIYKFYKYLYYLELKNGK